MILLCEITAILEVTTGGPQATAVQASWVDADGSTITPNSLNTLIAAAGTTTVIGSPAASTQRNVKFLSLQNTDPTVTNQITVTHFDGTTAVPVANVSLPAGHTLYYEDASGWYVTDGFGGRQGIQGVPGTAGTNGTNGTNGGNTGSAIINFGPAPGNNTAQVVVTGQAAILSTSAVQPFFMADTTTDHNAYDHMFAALVVDLTAGSIVPGVGFTVNATCSDNVVGTFEVRFVWN